MLIGEAAKQTGLGIDTLRFYEKRGLLGKPARSEGGYRVYSEAHVATLLFIRQAQGLGLSLDEIQGLLALRTGEVEACAPVRDLLNQKLQLVRAKIEDLREL